jgi:hypothetical protein
MKHRVKITMFDNGYSMFERLTMDDFKASLISSSNNGRIVKTEIVEWETKEPVRVADYLVEADWCCECASKKCIPYKEKTYPIGQQPEGSVMVPGSERNQE